MKRVIFFFSVLLFFHCAPKYKVQIANPRPTLSASQTIAILQVNEKIKIAGIVVGKVRSYDGGLSTACTYDEIIERYRTIARENGANIIKITEHKIPDHISTCERITAELYFVEDPDKYDTKIVWQKNRRLDWNDFKGPIDTTRMAHADATTYGIISYRVTSRPFSKPVIKVSTLFDCNNSWVKTNKKKPLLLTHEQLHFDLFEIYSRKLKKLFSETKFAFDAGAETKLLYKRIWEECVQRQDYYDETTRHGTDTLEQKEWIKVIESELDSLSAYSE